MAEGDTGWEPHGAFLARVTCHGEETLDPGVEDQLGRMVQGRWWEAEEAHHKASEALDVGLLGAERHAGLVGEHLHAARMG